MNKIKKGDIVGRISYGKDVMFVVDKIIKIQDGREIAILKGLAIRIKADSMIEDLEKIEKRIVLDRISNLEREIENRIVKISKTQELNKRAKKIVCNGKILHLDGDRKYSEKSLKYYKNLGIDAIVKNISESRQASYVRNLLERHRPDILVITGHDGMVKKGVNFNNIYNYRNSGYFIKTVREARRWNYSGKELIIFAGACQSFYEALIDAGANFASSPKRILIDFMDPLIVAEKVATTDETKFLTINDFENELRDGRAGIDGIGAIGKRKIIVTKM